MYGPCTSKSKSFPLISAWKMRTAAVAEQIQVFFTSQTKAQFSVLVCNRTQMASCESLGMHHSVSVVCIYYFLSILRLLNIPNCIHLLLHLLFCSLNPLINHVHIGTITGTFYKHVVLILISH